MVKTWDGSLRTDELLAVDAQAIWLGDLELGRPLRIARNEIKEVTVKLHDSRTGQALLHALTGVVSTATHGFFIVLTAPIWVLSGGIAIGSEEMGYEVEFVGPELRFLNQYARFPQGLPPSLRPLPEPPPVGP